MLLVVITLFTLKIIRNDLPCFLVKGTLIYCVCSFFAGLFQARKQTTDDFCEKIIGFFEICDFY